MSRPTPEQIHEARLEYAELGLRTLPLDDQKRPAVVDRKGDREVRYAWKRLEVDGDDDWAASMSAAEPHPHAAGLGVVARDRLMVLDFDAKYYRPDADEPPDLFDAWWDQVLQLDAEFRADAHYVVRTPSGGYHLYCRLAAGIEPAGIRATPGGANPEFAQNAEGQAIIESRWRSGYVAAPPTDGYEVLSGSPGGIREVDADT